MLLRDEEKSPNPISSCDEILENLRHDQLKYLNEKRVIYL